MVFLSCLTGKFFPLQGQEGFKSVDIFLAEAFYQCQFSERKYLSVMQSVILQACYLVTGKQTAGQQFSVAFEVDFKRMVQEVDETFHLLFIQFFGRGSSDQGHYRHHLRVGLCRYRDRNTGEWKDGRDQIRQYSQ